MTKTITAITLFVLIYTFYNYHISKGIPLLVLLTCLVILSFSLAKLYSDSQNINNETFEEVEKRNDKLLNENGIFEYKNDGFYINQKGKQEFVKWVDIEKISIFKMYAIRNTFKIHELRSTYQNGLEVVTTNKIYRIYNDKDHPGVEKLSNEISKNLELLIERKIKILGDSSEIITIFEKDSAIQTTKI